MLAARWDTRKVVVFPLKLVKGFPKCRICGKVKSTGTVIQDQDFRFFYKGTGNGKSLTLAAGKILSVLFQPEIKLTVFLSTISRA